VDINNETPDKFRIQNRSNLRAGNKYQCLVRDHSVKHNLTSAMICCGSRHPAKQLLLSEPLELQHERDHENYQFLECPPSTEAENFKNGDEYRNLDFIQQSTAIKGADSAMISTDNGTAIRVRNMPSGNP
jgi:hypothetical protein